MAKSDLLKQAIADAKAVKETALANAKLALQEAFTPRIKEMLANKLTTEIEGEEEDQPMDAGASATGEDMEAGAMETETGDDFSWTDNRLSASVGGNDYDFEIDMAGEEDSMEEPMEEPTGEEMEAEYNEGMDHGDELNLDEILRELEGDIDDMEMAETYESDDDETVMADEEIAESYKKLKSSAIGKRRSLYEDEDIADEEMDMDSMSDEEQDLDEIIEAILRETEEETSPTANPSTMQEDEKEEMIEELEDKVEEREEELKEAYRTVKRLQSVINEVNLLNAKLLYTNKLFRNFELSESQKMKVIENFDRAGNPREAKLVFATLAESFKRPTKKRVVKESYASKATSTTAPYVNSTQVLSEGFEMANRWKKLAGLL